MQEEKNILHGPKPLYPIGEGTVGQQLYKALLQHSNKHYALIDAHTGESISYDQLLKTTCSLAQALEKLGLTQNSVISICSGNNLFFFYPVIAALYLGVIVAPLNENYSEREMQNALHISQPQVIFCSKSCLSQMLVLQKRFPFIKTVIILDSLQDYENVECLHNFILRNYDANFDVTKFKPRHFDRHDQVAAILCSSGTTGLPKGVMITHLNLVTRLAQSLDPNGGICNNLTPGGSVLTFMPFFHAFGFITTIEYLFKGLPTVMLRRFDPKLFLWSIQNYKVESLLSAPPVLLFLATSPLIDEYDLSSLKELGGGAASIQKEVQSSLIKRFNIKVIRQGYGLTEGTFALTLMPYYEFRNGSAGKVISYVSAKVVDPKTQQILGRNESGELCFKGNLTMKGYARNEEETKNSFDKDGWLKTGDIGYFDEDGYVYIVGRLKELIKYKGFQVPPAELEELLMEHPSIRDAGVVGIPNEEAGELPAACVALQPGKHLTEKEVQDFVADRISSAKRLRGGVKFVNEIPKNSTGKIERAKLREAIMNCKPKL